MWSDFPCNSDEGMVAFNFPTAQDREGTRNERLEMKAAVSMETDPLDALLDSEGFTAEGALLAVTASANL